MSSRRGAGDLNGAAACWSAGGCPAPSAGSSAGDGAARLPVRSSFLELNTSSLLGPSAAGRPRPHLQKVRGLGHLGVACPQITARGRGWGAEDGGGTFVGSERKKCNRRSGSGNSGVNVSYGEETCPRLKLG